MSNDLTTHTRLPTLTLVLGLGKELRIHKRSKRHQLRVVFAAVYNLECTAAVLLNLEARVQESSMPIAPSEQWITAHGLVTCALFNCLKKTIA